MSLPIVDAQVHIWGANTPQRPWPADHSTPQKPHPVSHEMLLRDMDAAGVARAILIPPSWEGDRNDLALDAARLHPDRFAVMGRLPLDQPEQRSRVTGWRRQPGMLGLRFTFHTARQRPWLSDGTADWLWSAAQSEALPVMAYAPGSMPELFKVAERHPGLKLIIDHAGLDVGRRGDAAFADLVHTCALARLPNVGVKVSGMPAYSEQSFPFKDVHEPIRRLYDAFGPRRLMWGTDLTRMRCGYRECIDLFTSELPWLSGQDLDWIMHRSVRQWTGWVD